MTPIKPHGGFVSLRDSFDSVWILLSQAGDVSLQTEKKKTRFVARATMIAPKGSDKGRRAIVFLRRANNRGKLKPVATCLECCWGFDTTCHSQRTGTYCKALDKWASSPETLPAKLP
jgi:hypothetical protein